MTLGMCRVVEGTYSKMALLGPDENFESPPHEPTLKAPPRQEDLVDVKIRKLRSGGTH
jgi:hypothetical protein